METQQKGPDKGAFACCLFASLVRSVKNGYVFLGLELLRGVPITELHLGYHERGSDALLRSLHGLPIADLDLSQSPWVTDASLEYLAALPLRTLNLSHCTSITDFGLVHLTKLTKLTNLNLCYCPGLTNYWISRLVDALLPVLVRVTA